MTLTCNINITDVICSACKVFKDMNCLLLRCSACKLFINTNRTARIRRVADPDVRAANANGAWRVCGVWCVCGTWCVCGVKHAPPHACWLNPVYSYNECGEDLSRNPAYVNKNLRIQVWWSVAARNLLARHATNRMGCRLRATDGLPSACNTYERQGPRLLRRLLSPSWQASTHTQIQQLTWLTHAQTHAHTHTHTRAHQNAAPHTPLPLTFSIMSA